MLNTSKEIGFYVSKVREDPSFKGAVSRALSSTIYINQKSPKELRQKICKETILTIPAVIYTRKNFYLLDALNEKIEILKAAGLVNFWQHQNIDGRILSEKESNQPKYLTLQQLLGSFEIIIFGYVISFSAFLFELVGKSFRKRFFVKQTVTVQVAVALSKVVKYRKHTKPNGK